MIWWGGGREVAGEMKLAKVDMSDSALTVMLSRAEKTMTARDVTGFYAFFSARRSGNFLHIFERFPYRITQ